MTNTKFQKEIPSCYVRFDYPDVKSWIINLKIINFLQIGAEVETSFRGQESVGTIGYQIQIPKAELVFRGMYTSKSDKSLSSHLEYQFLIRLHHDWTQNFLDLSLMTTN